MKAERLGLTLQKIDIFKQLKRYNDKFHAVIFL